MEIEKRIEFLSTELLRHQYLYYVKAEPEISDQEYDQLFDELVALEKKHPEFVFINSPTKRIGSDLDNTFPERDHTLPVLSLDKENTPEGLKKWMIKTIKNANRELSFVVEEKMDGASIVLYYKNGSLDYALTRGNGLKGNDVTENIRTIKQIPLITGGTDDFAVRGEVFINKSEFESYNKKFDNKYSNPRNLAAGSLRNLKSSVAAAIPLKIIIYEGFFQQEHSFTGDHILILSRLRELGFHTNENVAFFSNGKEKNALVKERLKGIHTGGILDVEEYVNAKISQREKLDYEIDGLVIKVNEMDVRDTLGYTSHHPRWAIAFKFDSPTAETTLTDIQIQVGRNGRVTPVAILEPVPIAGSVVARATLHNKEYIDILELGKGDRVSISKRGDIIPAVEKVIEKNPDNPTMFDFPKNCPFCQSLLIKDGAHHFCKNRECTEKIRRQIVYFVSKNQMDIDTLGEKTIFFLFNKGFVTSIPDIYRFNYDQLLEEEGFKEKKISNIKKSVEVSKSKPFSKVLTALGFDGISTKAVSDLVKNGFDSIEKIIEKSSQNEVEEFSSIDGFGEVTAELLIKHFTDKENLELIQQLKDTGLNFKEAPKADNGLGDEWIGQIWVISGSFDHFSPRSKAAEEIEKRGGKVVNAISSKTTHLLAGVSPGSKLTKAKKLNTQIVNEAQFLDMLK
jgi:DNA ligase (NAD+)